MPKKGDQVPLRTQLLWKQVVPLNSTHINSVVVPIITTLGQHQALPMQQAQNVKASSHASSPTTDSGLSHHGAESHRVFDV